MRVVILAGGKGTRLSEETHLIPKPMSTIGGMPIILHIMRVFTFYGFNEFIILAGYKSFKIKEFFKKDKKKISYIKKFIKKNKKYLKDINVKIVDTGQETQTGGRILRAKKYIGEEDFFLTYGDCIANINIKKLLSLHKKNKKVATITAVNPQSPYGALTVKKNLVTNFVEKPIINDNLISGGFFVFTNKLFKLLKNDKTILEKKPLEILAKTKNLVCYRHKGFWHPMDSLRDKRRLEELWKLDKAPWKKFFK